MSDTSSLSSISSSVSMKTATANEGDSTATVTEPPRPPRFANIEFEKPRKCILGSEKHEIYLQPYFLKKSSDFLKARLAWTGTKTASDDIDLTDISLDHFELYMEWVITGALTLTKDPQDQFVTVFKHKSGDVRTRTHKLLTSLWMLGDRLEDMTFRNLIIERMMSDLSPSHVKKDCKQLLQDIDAAREKSTLSSILHHMLVGTLRSDHTTPEQVKALSRELLADIVLYLVEHSYSFYPSQALKPKFIEPVEPKADLKPKPKARSYRDYF